MKQLTLLPINPLNIRDPDLFVPALTREAGLVIDKVSRRGKHISYYYCDTSDVRATQDKLMVASKKLCASSRWMFPRWAVGVVNSLTPEENPRFELRVSVSQTSKVVTIAVTLKGAP